MKIAFRQIKSAVLGVKLERSICLNRIGAALVLLLLMPALSHAAGILQVEDLTAPNLIGDSNVESGGQNLPGPDVLTIGAKACNVGDQQLRDVTLYVGDGTTPGEFPDTIVPPATRPYEGTFELVMLDADRSDATRVVGFLDPGSCLTAYWQAQYPVVDANIDATWGLQNTDADDLALDFSVWGTSFDVPTGAPSNSVVNDTVTVRNEQDANPNKVSPTPGAVTVITPASAQVGVGEILTIEFQNATFGNINQGFDVDPADGQPDYNLWFQPVGETTWNTDVLRLVRVDAELRGASCGAGRPDVAITLVDDWHESGFDQYGTCSWDADYTYTFIALGPGVTATSPYQEASSGSNQEKFNGDYCGDSDPFTSPTSACFTLTALPGNPTLVKSVDKAVAVEGETLTYNLAYENTSTNSVGDPSSGNGIVIRDSIPSGIDYVAGSASCSAACTIRYSSDNGLTFEFVEPSPASLVTDLHFYLSDPIPGGATGTVTFQGIVETGFTGRITNIGEIAITGSAAITTDNAETLVGCEFDSDCDDGAYCNGAETCVSGACTAGTPVSCDDGQACTTESCNEATDSCDYTTNDAVCDDADACNGAETCVAGVGCQAGTPLVCDDSNECTTDSCNAIAGCQYANASAGTACGDGTDNDCTDPDTCDGAGSCQSNHASAGANAPTQCNDSVECTADQCDGSGGCQNPNLSAGTACGDGSDTACDNPDTCDGAGMCLVNNDPGAPGCNDADLSVLKSDSGSGVVRGGLLTYSILITNNGTGPATNVVAVDTLDPDTTYVSDTGGCTQAPAGTLTCALGALPAFTSTSFTITVSVNSSAPTGGLREDGACNGSEDLCNSMTVSATENDPNPGNNTETEPTNVVAPDLLVVKSDSGLAVSQLQSFAYTIVVTNVGVAPATNVIAVDTLDPDTVYISDTGGCTQAPLGTLTCPVGTLAPAASTSFQIVVQVATTAPTNGSRENGACTGAEDLCNGVTVTADEGDANPLNNTDDEPTNVSPAGNASDLSITKVDTTGPVQAGSFTTYSLTVTNAGPDTALDVEVVENLDPFMDFMGATVPCVSSGGSLYTCSLGDITAGGSVTFDFIVHIDPAAPTASSLTGPVCPGTEDVCNRATVSSSSSDPTPGDNSVEVATDVIATTTVSDLTIVKSDNGPEPVLPGDTVTYQIVVTNAGPDTATDVLVRETLDPYMTYVSDTAGCVVTTPSGAASPTYSCPLGDIAVGSSATFDITVTMALDAPIDSTRQDGDCNSLEDVCNEALVVTSSANFSTINNRDSEPTDVSINLTCNNGVLDAGEECDPPDAEVCNNGIDDDGDLLIDCSDPACQTSDFGCDGNCALTPPCQPILNDPAKISETRLKIHGRFIPLTPANPLLDGFRFVLANEYGEIYSGQLLPGDMEVKTGRTLSRWTWKDRSARRGPGLRDGLFRVGIHERMRNGEYSLVFSIKAFGDMAKAITPLMTSMVYVGDDLSYLEAEWLGEPGRWKLTQKQAGNIP